MIKDANGRDIKPIVDWVARNDGIPPELILACGIAESSLNPQAERWGSSENNSQALLAIADEDWGALQVIIDRVWPDISFGVAQRIVKYHWTGDHQPTAENCMEVRATVFQNEDMDIQQMGGYLKTHWVNAGKADLTPTGGDQHLLALCAYNAGHIPLPDASYWTDHRSTIDRYAKALGEARFRYLSGTEEKGAPVTELDPATDPNPANPPYIAGFLEQHPELGGIWTADGSPGEPIVVNDRLSIIGTAEHVLIEIDGYVSPVRIDMSFFAPPPQA